MALKVLTCGSTQKSNLGGGTTVTLCRRPKHITISQFLELADGAIAVKKPVKKKAVIGAPDAASSISNHWQND
ncbi:MAG: hypothetical protein LAO78_23600 [Acidobacteriia bacterium]|nr:hypothetical protein [Terriglobia bacterium]